MKKCPRCAYDTQRCRDGVRLMKLYRDLWELVTRPGRTPSEREKWAYRQARANFHAHIGHKGG